MTWTPSRAVRRAAAVLAVALLGTATGTGPAAGASTAPGEPPRVPGLVVHASSYDVPETAQRVRAALSSVGMVTATLDHQANAASVGQELRPTTLVIGGAPQAGTPLLQASQETGIDLPQKFLAWQDADGQVWLGYNSTGYVAAQAGVDPGSEALTGLREGSAAVAAQASGTSTPAADGGPVTAADGYLAAQTSDADVATAIDRYHAAFAAAGLAPLATVDHQAGAQSIGEDLRPTQVTFTGNPAAGTPLIQASQTMGIDLPTRYLAWRDASGTVRVGHADVAVLARRHGLHGVDSVVAAVRQATQRFSDAAAGGGGEVVATPSGGVAAGEGGTAGLESSGLLAVGVLALLGAGAVALLGRPRRSGRQL